MKVTLKLDCVKSNGKSGDKEVNIFVNEVTHHLTKTIIPFWKKIKDEDDGGYYGYLGFDLKLDPQGEKGGILNSRILWFFANAYLTLKEPELLDYANHAYEFLKEKCLDHDYGGVYWSLNYDGTPLDQSKHTYNQAFAIYALASYYDATKNFEALELANRLFNLIETKCKDEFGYLESFNRRFELQDNEKLSENGVMAQKTMNTLLHVFEAYSELYRVGKNPDVKLQLENMLTMIKTKVYNQKLGRQEVFFDNDWNSLIDLYSYGHDIETAWLVDRGLEIIKDDKLTEKIAPITKALSENVYNRAYVDHSLVNESENGVVDTTRVWWVQAEAVVGFVNAYHQTGTVKYLSGAMDIWQYIKEHMIDQRPGSEWFWSVDQKGNPNDKPIVGPWKCPYHNGRMCFEIIRRLRDVA